jgi:hypothetical protein
MNEDDTNPIAEWLGRNTSKVDPRAYEAFHPLDRRQLRVRFCPREQPWEWLPYASLQRIVTEADHGTRVALLWPFAVVIIYGRNLQALDYAIANESLDVVRAFDLERYDPPADQAGPFISEIEIHVHDVPERVKAEVEGDKRH